MNQTATQLDQKNQRANEASAKLHTSSTHVSPAVTEKPSAVTPFSLQGNFSQVSITQKAPPAIQPKLKIGAVNSPLEEEADRVAEQIVSMPEPTRSSQANVSRHPQPAIQRVCSECQKEKFDDEEDEVFRKAASPGSSLDVPASANINTTGGQPLPVTTRQFFEPRFGQDFSNVRIHTDGQSAQSAKQINAKAYTVGNHITFGQGEFNPQSESGQKLIAHELTHTVQQGNESVPTLIQREFESRNLTTMSVDELMTELSRVDERLSEPVGYSERQSDEFYRNEVIDALALRGVNSSEPANHQASNESTAAVQQSIKQRVNEFKREVRRLAVRRLSENSANLTRWREFLVNELSGQRLEAQLAAQETLELAGHVPNNQGQEAELYRSWEEDRNPLSRSVKEHQLQGRYRACTGCHEAVRARNWGLAQQEIGADVGRAWTAPVTRLRSLEPASSHETQGDSTGFRTLDSVGRIGPFLQELGPDGYQVLPRTTLNSNKSPAELLQEIRSNIRNRQQGYTQLIRMVQNGEVDYLNFDPIVSELLDEVEADVRNEIESERRTREMWNTIKEVAVAGAKIFLLVAMLFPPTAPLGVAAIVAGGTIAVGGAIDYRRGRLGQRGRGAHDVVPLELQQQADSLVIGGMFDMISGLLIVHSTRLPTRMGRQAAVQRAQVIRQGDQVITRLPDGRLVGTHAQYPGAMIVAENGVASVYRLVNGQWKLIGSRPMASAAASAGTNAARSTGTSIAATQTGGRVATSVPNMSHPLSHGSRALGVGPRPSWQQSEVDVSNDLIGWQTQQSFRDQQPIHYGARGSVRPDNTHPTAGMHVEVKNYDLTTAQSRYSMYRELARQARSRADHLPPGSFQGIIIDIRGQVVPPDVLQRVPTNIQQVTGGHIRAQDVIYKTQ